MYGMSDEDNDSFCTKVMVYKILVPLLGLIMLTKSSDSLLGRDNILFVTVEFCKGTEVIFTSSKVNDDGALGGVAVAVIGKGDTGVMLSTSGGTEVILTTLFDLEQLHTITCMFIFTSSHFFAKEHNHMPPETDENEMSFEQHQSQVPIPPSFGVYEGECTKHRYPLVAATCCMSVFR